MAHPPGIGACTDPRMGACTHPNSQSNPSGVSTTTLPVASLASM
jgi:hypothetical protein